MEESRRRRGSIPLAAFAAAHEQAPGIGATLRRAVAVTPMMLAHILFGAFLESPHVLFLLLIGRSGWLPRDGGSVDAAVVIACGVPFSLIAIWAYGTVLIGAADAAASSDRAWAMAGDTMDSIVVGAGPFVAAAAVGGGVVVRDAGFALAELPPAALAVSGLLSVAVAHVLSCALAVAIASRVKRVDITS